MLRYVFYVWSRGQITRLFHGLKCQMSWPPGPVGNATNQTFDKWRPC